MVNRLSLAKQLWQHYGSSWLAYRAWYTFYQRSGLAKWRQPTANYSNHSLSRLLRDQQLANPDSYLAYRQTQAPPFFFEPSSRESFQPYLIQWDTESRSPLTLANELDAGSLRYFQHTQASIGIPPAWHTNPFTGQTAPVDQHWSQISDFAYGDIKTIWEASRFGFVFALVRAYWRSGDEQYAESFWNLFMNWREQNPAWQGPNWKCGQETSLRVIAWCFGLYGFLHSKSTTPKRITALAQMLALSGERIEANLNYALSQRNNHGISEGMGLWTLGVLFPELKAASRWQAVGRDILEEQGSELIYEDGSFAQHSVNYHRLMLHDYLWYLRLAEIHDHPFSINLHERIALAGQWLHQIQAGKDGQVPYYGQNDGSLILPLNNCDYHDFRPVIQMAQYLNSGTRCYESGPWDEDLLWLFGPEALETETVTPIQTDFHADAGGYYTLRSARSMAFIRCASFRDRPSQADMLHLDLWWRGQNIAIDAGTFSYNADPPWNNPLAGTLYHNTISVDGLDQMDRAGKFLWLPWLHGHMQAYQISADGHFAYWQGQHDGYGRLPGPVTHQRGILRIGIDTWLILDRLQSQAEHSYRLHWLLADWPYYWDEITSSLTLQTPAGDYHVTLGTMHGMNKPSIVRADIDTPQGWYAPYYYYKAAALSLALQVQTSQAVFWTIFSPRSIIVHHKNNTTILEDEAGQVSVRLQDAEHDNIVSEIQGMGVYSDSLVMA